MSNSMDPLLDDELQALENQLAALVPSSISSDLIARMEHAMAGWDESDNFSELESKLNDLSPSPLSSGMLDRFSQSMEERELEVSSQSNVIPMDLSRKPRRKIFTSGMMSAAAAVALLGAFTAYLVPSAIPQSDGAPIAKKSGHLRNTVMVSNDTSATNMATAMNATVPVSVEAPVGLTSNELSHRVMNTQDAGVVISTNNTPHRCIRVDYIDKIKVKDEKGRDIEIKTPGVDYMLIPLETN